MPDFTEHASKGMGIFIIQALISGILRILNIVVLTQLLFQSQMGQIAVFAIIFGFMQFLGALGLNHTSPLIIPKMEIENQKGAIKGYILLSLGSIVVFSSFLSIIAFLVLPLLLAPSLLLPDLLQLILFIAPFSSLEIFLDSILLAKYSVRNLAAGRIAFDVIRVTSTVILVMEGMGIKGVLIGWLLSELSAVIIFGVSALRNLGVDTSYVNIRPIMGFALSSLLFQTIDVTIQNTDRIILLHLTDLTSLGVYDVLLNILFIMSFVSLMMANAIYPFLTKLHLNDTQGTKSSTDFDEAITVLLRYILIVLLPLSIIAGLNSSTLLTLLFGPSYALYPDASLAFAILVVSYSIWGITYALHSILRSMGETRFFVSTGVTIIIFEIVGCWYLTLWYGLLGAALIRMMYILLLFVTAIGRLYQKENQLKRWFANSLLKILIASLLSGFLVFLMRPENIYTLFFSVTLSLSLYLVLLLILKEAKELDFRLARLFAPEFLKNALERLESAYLNYLHNSMNKDKLERG